jgi:hypothetical protein
VRSIKSVSETSKGAAAKGKNVVFYLKKRFFKILFLSDADESPKKKDDTKENKSD